MTNALANNSQDRENWNSAGLFGSALSGAIYGAGQPAQSSGPTLAYTPDRLTDFAANGPLTGNALNQGVINTVVVKTSGGYVTITNGSVLNGLPIGWVK